MPSPTGRLDAIYTAPHAGQPVIANTRAVLTPDGLVGDRYASGEGSFSRWPAAYRAVSLIRQEAIDAAEAEFGVSMQAGEHRRNLVVSGVPLDAWRGVRFRIGSVELVGERLCAPCKYLVRVTGQADAFRALVGRGGLRARVVVPGVLRVGDAVEPLTGSRRALPG